MTIYLKPLVIVAALFWACACATETRIIADFNLPADMRAWEFKDAAQRLTPEHGANGKQALAVSATCYVSTYHKQDWSGFDSLDIDIFAEATEPVAVSVLVGDEAWRAKNGGSYWNRYNGDFTLSPGANTLSIPVGGLYRGEAGSRGNDIKTNIDPKTIIRFNLGFKTKTQKDGTLYLSPFRLVKESRPDGVLAYDFGPESQVVFPGFTPVSWNTVYGQKGLKYGLRNAAGGPNSARDDTFPTRLYQDFVNMESNEFRVDVADGLYHVWLVYDDCGYWGGEQAKHRSRKVMSNGATVWSEDRGADGVSDYLYRFENVEPKPGQSIWDLYTGVLFTPKRFDVTVKGGVLKLQFHSDGPSGSRVAALVMYPDSKKAEGEKYAADVEARNRAEFESRAVYMKTSVAANAPAPNANGYSWGYLPLDVDCTSGDFLARPEMPMAVAARGQRVSMSFAIRPTKDFDGPVSVVAADFKNGTATIPASAVECRVVHNALHRSYNSIAYTIAPETIRAITPDLKLEKDFTRQFWITIKVPNDAANGVYSGTVNVSANGLALSVPISLDVVPVTLDEPDFAMGPFGVHVPDGIADKKKALRDLLTVLKENGMNSFSGGPGVRFSGLDANGKPQLDFAACDELMQVAREVGFTKELCAYGGPGMVSNLHDSYTIGETGHGWEKKTGKSMGELLKIVWTAVAEHAKAANWLPIAYEMTDEPRVVEACRAQLELMKLYREAVPFVDIGGSYSVNWERNDPFELEVQNIFKTLAWSSLNLHNQTDFDKAKELGKRLYIYNQGTNRYSFGAYQWSEFRKGVRGRMQWHVLCLHGWQFFDLDGREPDTAMINWGRNEVIPTMKLVRCREGADDFRFATTLWNLAEKKKDSPAGKAALEWLDLMATKIAPGQNRAPKDFLSDDDFRRGCAERIRALIK
ncbi:MAG: hypothetical protein WCT04_16595 [Planctomycetota bacterium]